MTRGRAEAVLPPVGAQGPAQTEAAAVTTSPDRKLPPAARPGSPQHPAPSSGDTSSGKLLAEGAWGTGPDQFGRHEAPESNPVGPLAITVDGKGNAYVLDQVNGRLLRFDKNGKPLEPFALTQQAPHDVVVSPSGTTLVMDKLRDKSIAVLDPEGKLIGELPVTGKRLAAEDSGLATSLLVDADGVYVEKGHAMLFRAGDAAGSLDPDQPLLDGRPSRDGASLLSMGMLRTAPERFWLRSVDRSTGQMKFMRQYTMPLRIMHLAFLDSDASGRIYAAAHVGRELPVNPEDGRAGSFTDESLQVLCLAPTGELLNTLALPVSPLPDESGRDLAVRDDGTLLYMYRTAQGVRILQYTCG
jgi:hypothetical protein